MYYCTLSGLWSHRLYINLGCFAPRIVLVRPWVGVRADKSCTNLDRIAPKIRLVQLGVSASLQALYKAWAPRTYDTPCETLSGRFAPTSLVQGLYLVPQKVAILGGLICNPVAKPDECKNQPNLVILLKFLSFFEISSYLNLSKRLSLFVLCPGVRCLLRLI